MKKILTLCLFALLTAQLYGQGSSVVLHFGGSYFFYSGKDAGNFDKFGEEHGGGSIDGMIGFRSASTSQPRRVRNSSSDKALDKKEEEEIKIKTRSTVIGFFGKAGFAERALVETYLNDQSISYTLDPDRQYGDFQEIEFGMLLSGILRVSAGAGVMNFYTDENKPQKLNYFLGTAGLSIPMSRLALNLNFTAIKGKDFKNIVYRPSVGLVFVIK